MIKRKIIRCFTQTEVARQVKKKHKNQTGLDVEAQYWDIRFEDKTYVICEKVPYNGTNIVGPDQHAAYNARLMIRAYTIYRL